MINKMHDIGKSDIMKLMEFIKLWSCLKVRAVAKGSWENYGGLLDCWRKLSINKGNNYLRNDIQSVYQKKL